MNLADQISAAVKDPRVDIVGIVVVLAILAAWFVHDLRGWRRRGPLKIWYLREPIYPDEPIYSGILMQKYGCVSAAIGFVIAAIVITIIFFLGWIL